MRGESLKNFIPTIAEAVGKSSAALYERQRALVRAGLLQSGTGWGPGSGVRTTPETVSMLLIAILATDNLSETEDRTKLFARLKAESGACPLTGKRVFAEALGALLASESAASAVRRITVERTQGKARIDYGDTISSYFEGSKHKRPEPFLVSAQLVAFPLQKIAKALHARTKMSGNVTRRGAVR